MWQNIIFVGLGSIVGGVSRYFISEPAPISLKLPLGNFYCKYRRLFLTRFVKWFFHFPSCSGLSSLFYRRILW